MAERGRLYRWPRNRPFGDSKARPVLVVSPDAANGASQRRVVVPISRDPRLAWQPTTLLRDQLEGPLGRISPEQLSSVLAAMRMALDLDIPKPWQEGV